MCSFYRNHIILMYFNRRLKIKTYQLTFDVPRASFVFRLFRRQLNVSQLDDDL